MIDWLQEWYISQCNGEWEHDFGVKIETIDNPGWEITIDLEGTNYILLDKEWIIYEKSRNDWYGYKIANNTFNAAGDPSKLSFLISLFKDIITK